MVKDVGFSHGRPGHCRQGKIMSRMLWALCSEEHLSSRSSVWLKLTGRRDDGFVKLYAGNDLGILT
jgi:hypothetical protein